MADDNPIDELLSARVERDPRISDVFYFFEALTSLDTGRTIGRKIGVVQEILLRKYLENDADIKRRMYLEQKLTGRSGASHKVEFSWYFTRPSGSLENGATILPGLVLKEVDTSSHSVLVSVEGSDRPVTLGLGETTPHPRALRRALDEQRSDVRLAGVENGAASFDIVDKSDLLASLESKRVGAQRFRGTNKLGSGIQTIEKAKQASMVAIDLDLQYNHSVKPLEAVGKKRLLSLVALGNGVHWGSKDKAVLGTYVDYTFLVRDSGIIRYAEYVRDLLGDDEDFLESFMNYFTGMTKQEPDDFVVNDDDFEIVVPESEGRTLRAVLTDHLTRVNPL